MTSLLKTVLIGSGPLVLLAGAWAENAASQPATAPASQPDTQPATATSASQPLTPRTQPSPIHVPTGGGGRGSRG